MLWIVLIAAAWLGIMIFQKIKPGGSCCGEHGSSAAKINAADRDTSHYPYHYNAEIEGMVCSNCVRNAENAFNSHEGLYAKEDLGTKSAEIHSKHCLTRKEVAAMLEDTGFTLAEFKEE